MLPPLAPRPQAPALLAPGEPRARSWAAVELLVLGLIGEVAIWWGWVAPYRLDQYFRVLNPYPQDLAKINQSSPDSANAWAFTWIVVFAVLLVAVRRAPARPPRGYWAVLVVLAALFNGTLILMFPVGAADLFDQVFRGRILGLYGLNPFTTAPDALPDDILRPWVGGWSNTGSPYGPLWELPAAAMAWLGHTIGRSSGGTSSELWASMLAFKGLVIAAYGLTALALAATLRRLQPGWLARGLLLFLWNPLVLFETAGNGHNDMMMMVWVAGACWLLARGGWAAWLAPAALAAAALVKFVPVILLLPVLTLLWFDDPPDNPARRPRTRAQVTRLRLLRVGVGASLAALLGVVSYAPFWEGSATLGPLARNNLFTASIPKVVVDWLAEQLAGPEASAALLGAATTRAENLLRPLVQGLVGGWVLVQTLRIWWAGQDGWARGARLRLGYEALYEIMFVYLAFATLWFQPWYLQWLVPLAPLTLSYTRVARTLLFAAGGVANYFVWDYLWLWNRAPQRLIHATAALVVNTPTLLYTLLAALGGPRPSDPDQPLTLAPARRPRPSAPLPLSAVPEAYLRPLQEQET